MYLNMKLCKIGAQNQFALGGGEFLGIATKLEFAISCKNFIPIMVVDYYLFLVFNEKNHLWLFICTVLLIFLTLLRDMI